MRGTTFAALTALTPVLVAGPAMAEDLIPSPPTSEQIEAWTGLPVVSTSTLQGQSFGPAMFPFQKPAPCSAAIDGPLPPTLAQTLAAARQRTDLASLPTTTRGGETAAFRLQPGNGGPHLWVMVTLLDPHGQPMPALYANGLAQQCAANEGIDLRFEHAGFHWQIQGECAAMGPKTAATFARKLEQQLQPTWLTASACGGIGPLDAAFMQQAGLEAEQVVEALGKLAGAP